MIIKNILTLSVLFLLSFSVQADEMNLEQAEAEIERLELDNASLKEKVAMFEVQITGYKEKLEVHYHREESEAL